MKPRRHTPKQIIREPREANWLLAEGREGPEVAKQVEMAGRPTTVSVPGTVA